VIVLASVEDCDPRAALRALIRLFGEGPHWDHAAI
jgi:hypothetical protein